MRLIPVKFAGFEEVSSMEVKVNLIAPCGMNCSICMAYLRKKNKCNGCRAINTWNPKTRVECKIKNCKLLNSQGLEYCYQCPEYPCPLIKNMDKRYKARYRMSMIENLNDIKNTGIEEFKKVEKEKWKCKSCGGVINVHKGSCSSCEKLWDMK